MLETVFVNLSTKPSFPDPFPYKSIQICVAELLFLDNLFKAVRQAPTRCIFAGEESHQSGVATEYDHRQLMTVGYLTLILHYHVVHII